jgi:hypothetical protein
VGGNTGTLVPEVFADLQNQFPKKGLIFSGRENLQ